MATLAEDRDRKRREREARRRNARQEILALDGYTCQDPDCSCHKNPGRLEAQCLEVHHIILRRPNAPELDEPWNLITLCRIAHSRAQSGYKDDSGKRVTALDYMLGVLNKLHTRLLVEWWYMSFRWGEAREALRKMKMLRGGKEE
jgi:hypothetical protein